MKTQHLEAKRDCIQVCCFVTYLLNEEPDCLIHQVLQAKIRNQSKHDFIVDVESTLDELNNHLSKEDIKGCSEESLQSL